MTLSDTKNTYSLSFTALSLRPELARIVAELYLQEDDWETTRVRVLTSNALQLRNAKSTLRVESEIRQRLSTLTPEQIQLLAHATAEDRTAMAWLAVCKHIPFVRDFVVETARDKLEIQDPVLRPSDYESFVQKQATLHPKLTALTALSKDKIRQVLFSMLKEAGLLLKNEKSWIFQRPVLSLAVQGVVKADDIRWLAIFLVPEHEIANL